MKKVRLNIMGMSYSQSSSGAYALILGVQGENLRLPIIIGGFEAQAIAIELEKMKPSRPLTHDLFKNFALTYQINILEVVINKFEEGIFFAKLVCEQKGIITEIDSRTSDAIALALRFNCPIYTYQKILDDAAIGTDEELEDEKIKDSGEQPEKIKLEEYLLEELEDMLKKAVAEENYEDASRLRDEIKKRKARNG
ncbi:MAG TPA: bifunctional nuclease family protein [Bacteroidales bacterium]